MTDLVPPEDPEAWMERKKKEKRSGDLRFGFKVYIPSRYYERTRRGVQRNAGQNRTQISWADPKYQTKVSRGGTGYVFIGNHMIDPDPFWKAIHELHGLQSGDHEPGEVGFEWWIEHPGQGGFTLRAGYYGEVELKTRASYSDYDRYSVFRVEDLVKAFGLLGYLEQEGPQSLAPAAEWRPATVDPQPASPDPGMPEDGWPRWMVRVVESLADVARKRWELRVAVLLAAGPIAAALIAELVR